MNILNIISLVRYLIIIYLTVFRLSNLWGNDIEFRNITNQDGLSNSSVNCILQDSCGLVWFGTWDGLNMYNSRNIKVFKPNLSSSKVSISNNIIRNIVEEKKGILWIATDYGINRYNVAYDRFQNYFCIPEKRNVYKENSFFLAKEPQTGLIFSFINEYGLYYYDILKDNFIRLSMKIPFNIKKMFFDRKGNLWMCTDNGKLYRISLKIKINDEIKISEIQDVAPLYTITSIFYDDSHNCIWAQTIDGGLFYIDSYGEFHQVDLFGSYERITEMVFLDDQYCYVATQKGLYHVNLTNYNFEYILKDISINSLYLGERKLLWVGTDTRGVVLLSKRYNCFLPSSKIPKLNFGNAPVRTFWETKDGTLFIGTKGKGIFLYNKKKNKLHNLTTEQGLLHNSVYAFGGDEKYIWICTEGKGLNYFSLKDDKIMSVQNAPSELKGEFAICAQNDSILWVGTNGWGLFRLILNKEKKPITVKSYDQYSYRYDSSNCINNNSIFSLLLDGNQGLWIATRGGGLNYLDFGTNRFRHYRYSDQDSNSISNDDILCLYQDIDSSLWIGTSKGLNHMVDKVNGCFQRYTEADGIPNNTIHGILKDRVGNLWASTNNGLIRLDSKRKRILSYFQTDGLQDNEFSDGAAYESPYSHVFYFGGMNGYSSFLPSDIRDDAYMPLVYLQDFYINNVCFALKERLNNQGILELDHKESLLTLRFVPIDYIQGSKCEIAYRVEGNDSNWAYLGTSGTIVLNNLYPGNYTLYVKCCNANKEWDNNLYELKIHVNPPWWQSWYAYLLYVLFVIMGGLLLYRNFLHRLNMKQKLEFEILENQKAEEVHQAKLRFFTNIAHEFCNSLTLIYGPTEHLFKLYGDNLLLRRYLTVIKSNAERMQTLIKQLMDFRKAETGYLNLYVQNINIREQIELISANFVNIADEKGILFERNIASDISNWNIDKNAFEKVLFNLLSNAFKYTPYNGEVLLDVTLQNGLLRMVVKNTGEGIKEEEYALVFNRFKVLDRLESQILNGTEIRTGIGLALCKTLIDLMNGTISIDSKINEYTAFIVELPMLELSAIDSLREKICLNNTLELNEIKTNKTVKQGNTITSLNNDKKTLLVVDDDDEIRIFLSDILEEEYNVLLASGGEEALMLLEKYMPDLIICDIIMPKMNGFELIDKIKAQEVLAHIPVVLLTSDASVDSQIKSSKAGIDAYLTKPFHEKHLQAIVKQLLDSRRDLQKYFNSPFSSIERVEGKLIHKEDREFICKMTKVIVDNIANEQFSLDLLSSQMGVSKMQIYRKLKDLKGITPTDFIRKIRLQKVEHLLSTSNDTIAEIMYKCGFNNKAYFYRLFCKEYGKTPKEFRQKSKES